MTKPVVNDESDLLILPEEDLDTSTVTFDENTDNNSTSDEVIDFNDVKGMESITDTDSSIEKDNSIDLFDL
jgi:hypothetical protein